MKKSLNNSIRPSRSEAKQLMPRGATFLKNTVILGIAIAVVLVTYAVQFSVRPSRSEAKQLMPSLGWATLFAARGQENKYNPTKSLDSLLEQYHDTLNELFNKNIKITVSGEKNNVSTYDLAKIATDEYFEFREALINKRDILKTQIEEIMPKSAEKQIRFFERNFKVTQRASELARIDEEIEIARQTLDQALAAYNELQMALPLHRKYKEIIKALENYRDAISKIRREVDLYPVTFIDVTTPKCT